MDRLIKDPVMYCLNYRNCLGDRRRYYVAEREVVEAIKKMVNKLSSGVNEAGCYEAVFLEHSGARIVYNPGWEDSLEFIARNKKDAVLCAKEMGFRGLFYRLKRQNVR